jgi:hypothetical protein
VHNLCGPECPMPPWWTPSPVSASIDVLQGRAGRVTGWQRRRSMGGPNYPRHRSWCPTSSCRAVGIGLRGSSMPVVPRPPPNPGHQPTCPGIQTPIPVVGFSPWIQRSTEPDPYSQACRIGRLARVHTRDARRYSSGAQRLPRIGLLTAGSSAPPLGRRGGNSPHQRDAGLTPFRGCVNQGVVNGDGRQDVL